MKPDKRLFSTLLLLATATLSHAGKIIETDICVYGGAAGGVTAAVQVARMGKSVALVTVNNHIGGLSSGGLGDTDIGNNGDAYIQGMSREFYTRIGTKYGLGGAKFTFEPKVAEAVFNEMIADAKVPVYKDRHVISTTMENGRITRITTNGGDVFRAKVFIDASYEGDLMKQANVTYTSGREANAQYGETIDGIQTQTSGNQLPYGIDPFVVAGNPASGLLPGVNAAPAGANGSADSLIQAYCYRMCLTNVAANRVMIEQPEGYNEADYEILFRSIAAGQTDRFWKLRPVPNSKTDSNNDSGISCDFISGTTADWIEASYETREQLAKQHEKWQRGLVWTVQNHPRVPAAIRSNWSQWGLAKDEFPDTDHWPHQLYIREARRMVSDYVMTEKNCMGTEVAPDSIGMGAYTMDSHNCQRIVLNGMVKNEGDIQRAVPGPYPISYRSIVPKTGECTNLLVPWSLSATHIAFGSIRMEPVFMILGQSAATAAAFAIDDKVAVQAVPYAKLKAQLLADGQRLTNNHSTETSGIILDNSDATGVALTGTWTQTTSTAGYYGGNYIHDGNTQNGSCSARFTPTLPNAGTYEVFVRWPAYTNRATNVPVDIRHSGGLTTATVNQQTRGGEWVSVGSFSFAAGNSTQNGSVTIRNTATNGYVIADAVRFMAGPEQPVVNVWATNGTVLEPQSGLAASAKLSFNRTGARTAPLVIKLAVGGAATAGSDYPALPATVTIPAGAGTATLTVTPAADSLAEGSESVVVSIGADAAYVIGELPSAELRILDGPFDFWKTSHFRTQQLADPLISGADADPDQDGSSNLVEFFAGRDPLVVDGAAITRFLLDPAPAVEVERNREARELFMRLEGSRDLASWQPEASAEPDVALGADDAHQVLRFPIGSILSGGNFFRVSISRTPFAP
ncbi:FAD-dependent oxidoreductase [Haloferula sp. BvORR071]|uniref:FAD-dependent oxidoreductase n=1 Tax=Haloferula sp. BvORR071 TaxID=1396141 RepID=UPI0009465BED|nr:FAD-dependent oxidoreductase [Haloferula sp. BvORR071]